MTSLNAIGLMSGTSMDGIDCALIKTNGLKKTQTLATLSYVYDAATRQTLKAAEKLARETQGHKVDREAQKLSTRLHVNLIQDLLEKNKLLAKDIDVIGYHGQTLYHNPKQKISLQIGDAVQMANALKIPVVNNFREQDVVHGGQGAPLAPLYHFALAKRDGLQKLAIINCGGIANITLIDDNKIIGFDTGPGNGLLDQFVSLKTEGVANMDANGKYGLKGALNTKLLQLLLANPYLTISPPKSLDIADFILPRQILTLSIEDGCKTLAAFTAKTIVDSLDLANMPKPNLYVLAGGGWNNPVIKHEFEVYIKQKLNSAMVKTSDEIGWPNQYLEAEAFAFLAVRHLKKLPISLPEVTGVNEPMLGGDLYV